MYGLYGKRHYDKHASGSGASSRLTERQKQKRTAEMATAGPSGALKDTTPTASGSVEGDNEIIFIEDSEDEDEMDILVKKEDKAETRATNQGAQQTAQRPVAISSDGEMLSTLALVLYRP